MPHGISKTPTIEFLSSYGNQGIFDTTATLVALGPTPDTIKYVSDPIPIMHTNQSCDIHGEIIAVAPDKSFDVQFFGKFRGRERYVFTKGKWTPSGTQADLVDLCDG